MHLGSVVIISRMMYMYFLLINSILISCFICYLMTTLIFFFSAKPGWKWVHPVLYLWLYPTFNVQIGNHHYFVNHNCLFSTNFFFLLYRFSPLFSVLEIETKISCIIARRTLYHTLVCKVKTKQRQVLPSVLEFETKILCRIARHTLYLKGLHSQL